MSNNIANPVTEANFGRQVSFTLLILANNGVSEDTQLVVTLPPGAGFQSAGAGLSATVSGSATTGEQVTLGLGEIAERSLNNFITISIGISVPDGTLLQASFQASGHLLGSTQIVSSNVVSTSFQAGFLPVGVYLVSYDAPCNGSAQNGDGSFAHFNSSDGTGVGGGGSVVSTVDQSVGGLAASTLGTTDRLSTPLSAPFTPTKVGEITGPTSLVTINGIGGQAAAHGGYQLFLSGAPPAQVTIDATSLSGNVSCGGVGAGISFLNPNPFPVPLNLDQRFHAYSAAGDEVATDPISGAKFGFPGSADIGGGDLARSGGGIENHTYSQRLLYTASGNAQRIQESATCFSDVEQFTSAFDTCNSLPTDTTSAFRGSGSLFPSSGGLLVPANAVPSTGGFSSFNAEVESDLDASGSSNFAHDPNTGAVTVIRSGFGAISASVSVRILRGDADVNAMVGGLPAKVTFTGNSPINITVTEPTGRRAGFQPAPNPPPQFLDARPSVFTEIPGASYTGIDSHPQVIEIPDPGPGNYQVQVMGTGTGSFLLTTQTLDINDRVIDDQSVSGTATLGSSASFTFDVDSAGRVSIPGTSGGGTTPPTTAATLSPAPNAAGWNNSDVTVMLAASANPGGSGVKQITYSASGAQSVSSTTVNSASASIVISTEGTTTISFFATDNSANVETSKRVVVMLDKTPPAIICGAADGLWHATDVSIACTASDGGSGLANSSDASFSVNTAVPAGTETANTATGTHQVCDIAGNCATAGPISGNKVDKKPPSISITAPASTNYLLNQAVNAQYACTDGGSGVATCAGTVASGARIDTGSTGSKTFTVNAADNVGNVSPPQSVTYTVSYNLCPLYDPTRAVQSGSTLPLKFQLCDVNNADVSNSSLVVHALSLVQVSTNSSEVLQASGNANPDNDFRFDSSLGPTGGYIFNLSTKGLTTGSYLLTFSVDADPTPHTLTFQVR